MDTKSRRIILLLVLVAAFIATQNVWRINLLLNPVDTEVAPGDVALYGTRWCHYCAKVRTFFELSDIPYADFDIERSDAAARAFRELGGRGVPLVRIGDRVIHGFAPREMRAALNATARQPQAVAK